MASKGRKNKVKFKFTKELAFLLVFIVVIVVATIILNLPTKTDKFTEKLNNAINDYNAANNTQLTTLGEDHNFKSISYEDILEKKNNEGFTMVYYGYLTSGATDYYSNLLNINHMAENYEYGTVYLYFADWYAEQDSETLESVDFTREKAEKESKINEGKATDVEEFDMSVYPTLLLFKDGSLIFNSQTYEDDTETNWYDYITKAFSLVSLDKVEE